MIDDKCKYRPSQIIQRLTPARMLLFFYIIALIISTLILSLPIAYQYGETKPFIDILFTAVSALSVTGLTTFSISDTFSFIGLIFITIILHLGLFGVMSISTIILMLFGRRIGISERRLIMQDQNLYNYGGMVHLIKRIVTIVFTVEVSMIIFLGTYFLKYFPTAKEAYFQAYFHTISALSNGGFALQNDSLIPYAHDYVVQIMIMFLIIVGAIGFPVLVELSHYLFKNKKKRTVFRFSLYTKLTTTTFFLLIVLGALFIYLSDINRFFADKNWHETLFFSLFQSVTTRSAGLSTMDISLLSETNELLMSLLMFIGASPSSAGGGIRTTTFALVIIFIITYARGGKSVNLFNREVYDDDLTKAVTVTLLAIMMFVVGVITISFIEPFPVNAIIFEVASAFGTVGLSQGITSELTVLSKIILMIFMFIGRIGLVTFIFTFRNNVDNGSIRYPKERLIIG